MRTRSRIVTVTLALTACWLTMATALAGSGRIDARDESVTVARAAGPGESARTSTIRAAMAHGPIVNKVIDLLDEPIAFSVTPGTIIWESAPFDTSQFSRIAIRSSASPDSFVWCQAVWQFTQDDEFLASGGMGYLVAGGLLFPSAGGPSEVAGLRGKIVCRASGRIGVAHYPDLGDDRTRYPTTDPEPVAGTLTDVKVLLRKL